MHAPVLTSIVWKSVEVLLKMQTDPAIGKATPMSTAFGQYGVLWILMVDTELV